MKRFLAWSAAFGLLGALALIAVFVTWNWRDVFGKLPPAPEPDHAIEIYGRDVQSEPQKDCLKAMVRGGKRYMVRMPCEMVGNMVYNNGWHSPDQSHGHATFYMSPQP